MSGTHDDGTGPGMGEEIGEESAGGAEQATGEGSPPDPSPAEPTTADAPGAGGVDELEGRLASLKEQHLRLAADFDNYRRRTENEMAQRWTRAQADLVGKIVEALDDLQRVAQWEPETTSVEAIVEGVDLVERKFLRSLTDAGIEVLEPEGEVFDPNTMEAMMKVPAESEEDDERVHQVFQKGYLFKGQLVRPARVSVLKHD